MVVTFFMLHPSILESCFAAFSFSYIFNYLIKIVDANKSEMKAIALVLLALENI